MGRLVARRAFLFWINSSMRWNEIITEGRDAPLYHAIRDLEHAATALKTNRLAATTTQRFWADGKRRIQQRYDDEEYENSYWMKGVSLTRDIQFACDWGGVILVLDQAKLARRYKIMPLNWMYSIKNSTSRKKEREEFLIVKATPDDYIHPEDYEGEPRRDRFDWNRWRSIEGYVNNLDQYILGIYVDEYIANTYEDDPRISIIRNHPKFLGCLDAK